MKKSLILIVALCMTFNNALAYSVHSICAYNGGKIEFQVCPAHTAMAGRVAILANVNCAYMYDDPANPKIDKHMEHVFFQTRCLALPGAGPDRKYSNGSYHAPETGPACIRAVGCDGQPGRIPTAPVLDTNGNVAIPPH